MNFNDNMPQSRYVVPNFEERTPYGARTVDPYSKLFEQRIVFIGTVIDDTLANDVMAQLLILDSMKKEDITLYINSPGGSMTALTAIIDTMNFIKSNVTTICLGQASSAAAVLLSAGTKGQRFALPNARVMLHQPSLGSGIQGQASDLEVHTAEIIRTNDWLLSFLSKNTGLDIERIERDLSRDFFMSAEEAVAYNLIDGIIENAN